MGRGWRPTEAWLRACVCLAPALVTVPRFWNGFVYDDVFVIVRGEFIHDLGNLPRAFAAHTMVASSLNEAVGAMAMDTYRPLTLATFFLDAALSGRAPWAYHLTSCVLHCLASLLVFALLRRTYPAAGSGRLFPMALCFALAPWLAEAHVFVNGRSDPLMTVLFLSAALVGHRCLAAARVSPSRWLALAALVLGSLLAKETAALAIPLLWLLPIDPATAAPPLRLRAQVALPTLVALLTYLAARVMALRGLHTHAGAGKTLAALANLPLLWLDTLVYSWLPSLYALRSLRDDYAEASPWRIAAGVIALALTVVIGLAALRRRAHAVAFGLALALATASPAVMVTTELWPGFGRYLYLPAVGVLVALTGGYLAVLRRAPRSASRRLAALPFGVALLSAACLADATLGYRDDHALYGRALARAPEQAWTHGSLGSTHQREGRCDRAVRFFSEADLLAPRDPRYAIQLARCLVTLGALGHAREVAHRGRARFRDTRGEAGFLVAEFLTLPPGHPDGVGLMRRCLALAPGRPDCAALLASALHATRAELSPRGG